MKREKNTFLSSYSNSLFWVLFLVVGLTGCKLKNQPEEEEARQPVARVTNTYLYHDELTGIVTQGILPSDSVSRVEAYINSWIRKQLLIQEASRKIDFNEAEIERKILDYRYSLIAYEYQSHYIKQNLDTAVSNAQIEAYYKENVDNFILKQNIVRATFIKVPKSAPKTNKIKDLIFSKREKDIAELKSYCLSFSAAYHLSDSTWMVFDELVRNSPLAEIPNKIQFLKANPYYETSVDDYLYFFRVLEYRISDNISPLEFVRDDIRNIILNKRKVELARQLEDEVYNDALGKKEFQIYNE